MATLSACSSSPSWPPLPDPNPNNHPPSPSPPNSNFISSQESLISDETSSFMNQLSFEEAIEQHHVKREEDDDDEEAAPSSVAENPNLNSENLSLLTESSSLVPSLLHLSFNQDHGCFAVGTDNGFRIYNCDPFREIFRRDFDDGGGIGVVEMLFRCNILALVGGGPEPQYPLNKVMIWDDHQSRCIGELSFRSEVRAVRLRRDRIIVVLEQKIFVYNFADLKLLHQIETISNPKGLCVVSQVSGSLVLVCPGLQKGQVRVEHYGSKRTKFIMAHDSRIACFALTQDGRLLATASTKGTLVRIFNTSDGTLLQEVRRGADRAEIYSLAFSSTTQWLAVSSDKGTVHVFSLKINTESPEIDKTHSSSDLSPTASSPGSSLSFIRGVLPKYFNSEWSVAQFRLHEGSQYIVAFGHQKNTVVILGMDGRFHHYRPHFDILSSISFEEVPYKFDDNNTQFCDWICSFYRCQFDPASGGEMTQLEFYNFLKPEETF